MSRLVVFAYGVAAYGVFFVTYLYAAGFVGNLVVPKSLDSAPTAPFGTALLINLGLLGLFAVQHSVMARPWFKRALLRVLPQAAERSTYVLASSLALILLFWQWSPLGGVIWEIENPTGRAVMYGAFAIRLPPGARTRRFSSTTSTCSDCGRSGCISSAANTRRSISSCLVHTVVIRHPLYLGWFFAFWATPTMTVTHLLFAVMTTGYILIAIQLEERDLIAAHPEYAEYQAASPDDHSAAQAGAEAGSGRERSRLTLVRSRHKTLCRRFYDESRIRMLPWLRVLVVMCLGTSRALAQDHSHRRAQDSTAAERAQRTRPGGP